MRIRRGPIRAIKRFQRRIGDSLAAWMGLESGWLAEHVAHCPVCQKRAGLHRQAELGLSLIKSQPRTIDLVKKANAQAVSTLQRSLRQTKKSDHLRQTRPKTFWSYPNVRTLQPLLSTAACLMVILLVKTGVFASMNKVRETGTNVVHSYYAHHLGQEMADDLFKA
ncbi:MAG: hypothetical protein JXA82_10985 [Sedimentisphaerales bacterium]|nr:hypothetical protein [Sedimentisphaerales bacterium]